MEKAFGIMNCSPPANMKPFNEMQKEISNSYCEIAKQTMVVAAGELAENEENVIRKDMLP